MDYWGSYSAHSGIQLSFSQMFATLPQGRRNFSFFIFLIVLSSFFLDRLHFFRLITFRDQIQTYRSKRPKPTFIITGQNVGGGYKTVAGHIKEKQKESRLIKTPTPAVAVDHVQVCQGVTKVDLSLIEKKSV